MKHLTSAYKNMSPEQQRFIKITDASDVTPLQINFLIQDKPVGYCEKEGGKPYGVVGLQATDLLEYVRNLFISLDEAFPCSENNSTIRLIYNALTSQRYRTDDRESRGVEGKNEK